MVNWPKQRAWGWYATLIRTPWFCVKLLRFKPCGKLSMQRHKHRTEIWCFIKGNGIVKQVGDVITSETIHRGELALWVIKPSIWHQFRAANKPVYAIELQYGKKVSEDDIERKVA